MAAGKRWGLISALRPLLSKTWPVLILLASPGPAAEPPIEGRPPDFSGAVGTFRVQAFAGPTELIAGEPLLLRIRVEARGPFEAGPETLSLQKQHDFAAQFHIRELPSERPTPGVWDFRFELRPRTEDVKAVPAVRFDFFHLATAKSNHGYQSTYTSPIALIVHPRPDLPPDFEPLRNVAAFPTSVRFFEANPDRILHHNDRWHKAHFATAVAFALGLPGLLGFGLVSVRNSRRHLKLHQCRRALASLQKIRTEQSSELVAYEVERLLVRYLRAVYGLEPKAPVPEEVFECLRRYGYSDDLAATCGQILADCAAARFSAGKQHADPSLIRRTAVAIGSLAQLDTDKGQPC